MESGGAGVRAQPLGNYQKESREQDPKGQEGSSFQNKVPLKNCWLARTVVISYVYKE